MLRRGYLFIYQNFCTDSSAIAMIKLHSQQNIYVPTGPLVVYFIAGSIVYDNDIKIQNVDYLNLFQKKIRGSLARRKASLV